MTINDYAGYLVMLAVLGGVWIAAQASVGSTTDSE